VRHHTCASAHRRDCLSAKLNAKSARQSPNLLLPTTTTSLARLGSRQSREKVVGFANVERGNNDARRSCLGRRRDGYGRLSYRRGGCVRRGRLSQGAHGRVACHRCSRRLDLARWHFRAARGYDGGARLLEISLEISLEMVGLHGIRSGIAGVGEPRLLGEAPLLDDS